MNFERRVLIFSTIFVLALMGAIGLTVKLLGITVPDCLPGTRPFARGEVIQQAPGRYEIHYLARMWAFDPPEISLPPGSLADIYLATKDVTHGMEITGTNVNIMAVPGAVNYARIRFDKEGDYHVVCNEYCGVQHHSMAAIIHVTKQALAPPKPQLAAGAQILDDNGCTACHTIDGSPSAGPTFKGLYGKKRVLADGTIVVADDKYLHDSIDTPDKQVVKGFEATMPALPLSESDENKIIEFIKTLK